MNPHASLLSPPVCGGCLCGATRYVADQILWSAHCHCASCRRATGAGFASYLGVAEAGLHWQGPEPLRHASSPGTDWLRCACCGSPLAYRSECWPGEVHLQAGSLDRAELFRAEIEVNSASHLGWTELARPAPHRMGAEDDPAPVLALIRAAFAYMEGRIDPPSSMRMLTGAEVQRQAAEGEVWLIGCAPEACVFLTPKPGVLYVGKLATAEGARRRGHARALLTLAEARARALGLPLLELKSRVELVENHAAFKAMGFAVVGATRHPGYDRDTSLTFRRPVSEAP